MVRVVCLVTYFFYLLSAFCDFSSVAIRATVKNLATVRAHPILLFSLESDSCSHPSSSSAGSLSVLAQVLSERSRLGLLLLLLLLANLAQSPGCVVRCVMKCASPCVRLACSLAILFYAHKTFARVPRHLFQINPSHRKSRSSSSSDMLRAPNYISSYFAPIDARVQLFVYQPTHHDIVSSHQVKAVRLLCGWLVVALFADDALDGVC